MMKVARYPNSLALTKLLERPVLNKEDLSAVVTSILNDVKTNGDDALRNLTKQFDQVDLEGLIVSDAEKLQAGQQLPEVLKNAIQTAANNIEQFHSQQRENFQPVETMPGVKCWRKSVAIEKVGLYIPGGTAPLFSTVLMLAIPAKLAGCREIILCTPPAKDGSIHPAILYAAEVAGVATIYKVGGAQAIAAMAYGTATISKVDKIFGPGNKYVTAAKMMVQQSGVAIDMPAGPSEVLVYADETAVPEFVASDLLSQAEHDVDSQVVLLTTSEQTLTTVQAALKEQMASLPRQKMLQAALANSVSILLSNQETVVKAINEYAPEHLILACANETAVAAQIMNAGSVFIGNYTPESAGDYASGTNHTLPTSGFAKSYSGVSLDSFLKKITFQQITKEGLQLLGPTVMTMATAEQLPAHANAVAIRLQK